MFILNTPYFPLIFPFILPFYKDYETIKKKIKANNSKEAYNNNNNAENE